MNVLSFINQNKLSSASAAKTVVVDPREQFFKDCSELEAQCPNLALVRRFINTKARDQDALPDCEINYELGFVYDPKFMVREWHRRNVDKVVYDSRGSEQLVNRRRRNITKQEYLLSCFGYNWQPWNCRMDSYYDDDTSGVLKKEFEVYKQCCEKKDWFGYIQHNIKYIENSVARYVGKPCEFEFPSNWDEILTGQLRNYYKIDVMNELVWKTKNLKLWLYRRKFTEEPATEFHCELGKYFRGFSYKTFSAKNVSKFKAEDLWNADGSTVLRLYGTTVLHGYGKKNRAWLMTFFNDAMLCYDINHLPQRVLRFESSVVKELEQHKFWNEFVTRDVSAQLCFELYTNFVRTFTDHSVMLYGNTNSKNATRNYIKRFDSY
jgi:hypothetical protein